MTLHLSIYIIVIHQRSTKREREEETEQKSGTDVQHHPASLTVEDARGRVLGDHGAVLLIAVVSTVI